MPPPNLAFKPLINLLGVESNNDRTVDDNHWSGHVTKFLKVGQSAGILRYVSLLELYALLRKILLRLIAEHSPALRIDDDFLCHFLPPAASAPIASKRWMDSVAPLITSRTGWSE